MSKLTAQVSLIMTVRDEAASLPRLLDSVLAQSVLPAEVVVVDGGSSDGTQAIARSFTGRLPLRLIERPGANISQGRNAAIRAAAYGLIAVTDAGVRLDPGWLRAITRPLLSGEVDVASGFFVADPHTPFERAMGATALPTLGDINPRDFLPSSRSVAFRRTAWAKAGGYPEWLDYCEDLVFDMRLKATGSRFAFAPEARVYFRPRSTLRAFFLQYYRYARGDGKADLWRKRHALRYAAYTWGPLLTLWGWKRRRALQGKAALALVLAGVAAYCRRPYMRLLPLLRALSLPQALYALALVPVIRLTGDLAKMLGYPVGLWWRLANRRN